MFFTPFFTLQISYYCCFKNEEKMGKSGVRNIPEKQKEKMAKMWTIVPSLRTKF